MILLKSHGDGWIIYFYLLTNIIQIIFPNMKLFQIWIQNLLKKTKELTTSKNVPDNMIKCLTHLGSTWKKDHIHKNIIKFTCGSDHSIYHAAYEIRNF